MRVYRLYSDQTLPVRLDAAWEFFSDPANLNAITPPQLRFRMEGEPAERMFAGQILCYRIRLGPGIWWRWITEIKQVEWGRSFIDEQRFGPYRFWHHRHLFTGNSAGTRVEDFVHYGLGFGPLGALVHGLYVRRQLEAIFAYRRNVLARRFGPAEPANLQER